MRNECEIVRDLLPLYAEGMTSPSSNEFIEAHLKTCRECSALFAEMKEDVIVSEEGNEPELPLKAFSKTYQKKKRTLGLLIGSIAAAVLIALYAWLSTPQYLKYSESVDSCEEQASGLLIHFKEGVHHVSVSEYDDPADDRIYCDVECWTSVLDRLWRAPETSDINVKGDVIYYRDNGQNSPGTLLYGQTDGYSFSLRRLTLNYYFWLALIVTLISGLCAFVFRKRKAGDMLAGFTMIPLAWCVSSIIVERGISASTWSIIRDFSLIVLLWIALCIVFELLWQMRKEKQSVLNAGD